MCFFFLEIIIWSICLLHSHAISCVGLMRRVIIMYWNFQGEKSMDFQRFILEEHSEIIRMDFQRLNILEECAEIIVRSICLLHSFAISCVVLMKQIFLLLPSLSSYFCFDMLLRFSLNVCWKAGIRAWTMLILYFAYIHHCTFICIFILFFRYWEIGSKC